MSANWSCQDNRHVGLGCREAQNLYVRPDVFLWLEKGRASGANDEYEFSMTFDLPQLSTLRCEAFRLICLAPWRIPSGPEARIKPARRQQAVAQPVLDAPALASNAASPVVLSGREPAIAWLQVPRSPCSTSARVPELSEPLRCAWLSTSMLLGTDAPGGGHRSLGVHPIVASKSDTRSTVQGTSVLSLHT